MYNDLFSIGPFTVHGYGLMIVIGMIAAYLVSKYRAKRMNINTDHIDSLAIWGILGGVVGAKIMYWLTQIENIIQNPRILLNIADGFVVYGGIIGGVLAGYLYCRHKKILFLQYLDLIIPTIALAQGFGRIGCFLAGCCYGLETTGSCYVVFPSYSFAPAGVPLIPTQLISSGLDFLLFVILILYAKRKKAEGQVAALYMVLYSAGRFVLEFFRGDLIRGSVGALTTSQFISIWVFVIGVGVLIFSYLKKESGNQERE